MKLPDQIVHFPFFASQIMVIFEAKVNIFLEIGSNRSQLISGNDTLSFINVPLLDLNAYICLSVAYKSYGLY